MAPPPSTRPAPSFISFSAASEIITSDQEFNAADFVAEDEETGAAANALVTPAALSLLNGFLDNLLFNILAASRSTQLAAIRPAVADVLKPRLAGEVVATADEELSEYMGGIENEQTEFRGGQQPAGDFDLIRAWKLTRLRCMVYTRLGDMEEEDEDEFILQERLGESDGVHRRFSSHVDNITPAAVIFLTSIMEHIGERALVIAGETARSRLSAKLNDGEDETGESDDRKRIEHLVVEDLDMEKLALNATLGRLWRTWRKRRRGSAMTRSLSRAESRESFRRRGHSLVNSRKSSIATIEEPVTQEEPVTPEEIRPEDIPLPVDPTEVPLPMSDYDVQEIEVPGYSADLDGEVQTMQAVVAHKVRPRSLMVFSNPPLSRSSPGSRSASPVNAAIVEIARNRHSRSRSLPNTPSPSREVEVELEVVDQPSPSASEENRQLETMYEDDESAEFVDAAESAPGIAITTASDDLEVSVVEKARMSVVHEEEEETAPPVHETIASLRDGEVLTDQSNSARVSVATIDEPSTHDPEVIEGQGMCEKPTLTSTIQRPKRRSMRDSALLDAKTIVATTSEAQTEPEVEASPSTQGAEPASASTCNSIEAVEPPFDDKVAPDGDRIKEDAPITPATETAESVKEDVVAERPEESQPQEPASAPQTPRPDSASGDSQHSQQSRRDRPSPLLVASSNRSSPGTAERASVQRMPRPSTSVPSSAQKSRRSESFSSGRDKRPVTSSSATSQVSHKLKGLMGRPQPESPSFRVRSSSETSRASGSADSADNDTTDLDKLINSDETIHYTLTPRSVREMTFPDNPRPIPRSNTADTSDLAEFLKTTGPPREDVSRSRASVSSKATTVEVTSLGRSKPAESPKHALISSRMTMSPKSPASGQARDARAQPESTQDFADFLKSSGPTSAPYGKTSSPVENKAARPPSTFSTSTTRSNRPRLQARAADTKDSHTSDLIDFIREGPSQPGAHRIPRTVAPFRNTVDSDDLQLDSAKHVRDQTVRSSIASSTPDGSATNKSLTSLGSTNRVNSQAKATSSISAKATDDARPARKQRRVLDPYAIDDEEDDDYLEELINAKPPQREEESLIDFLRSAPPPEFESPPSQPLILNSPSSTSSLNAFVRGPSAAKSRVPRQNADKAPSSKISISSIRSQSTLGGPQSPSSYTSKVSRERNPRTIPSSTHRQTETSALADFLRNTGPPEPPANRASSTPMTPKVKEGSFTRFFARRRKVEA